jgi:hypothetical protein
MFPHVSTRLWKQDGLCEIETSFKKGKVYETHTQYPKKENRC